MHDGLTTAASVSFWMSTHPNQGLPTQTLKPPLYTPCYAMLCRAVPTPTQQQVAPTKARGTLGSLNQLMICLGILAALVVNVALPVTSWRTMFMLATAPAALLFLGEWREAGRQGVAGERQWRGGRGEKARDNPSCAHRACDALSVPYVLSSSTCLSLCIHIPHHTPQACLAAPSPLATLPPRASVTRQWQSQTSCGEREGQHSWESLQVGTGGAGWGHNKCVSVVGHTQ